MGKAGINLAATAATLALVVSVPASAGAATFRGPDRPATTPAAKAGSRLASKAPVTRAELRRGLAHQVHAQGGVEGVYVRDLDARHRATLFSANSRASRLLASNTKLFTTAAVLDRFGPGRRFATRLWERGRRTGAGSTTLKGSVALVGGGDPALASGAFAQAHNLPLTRIRPLAKAVRQTKIRRIDGNVRADPTIFDSETMPRESGITGNDLGSLSGLEFNSGWIGGHPAAGPARLAGRALRGALRAEGVKVTGKVIVGAVPKRVKARRPTAVAASPTVTALITEVNTPSDATWAEMLTKRLAAGGKKQGTTARGVHRIERFARSAGSHVSLENGSGLSRRDVSSARNVVLLLKAMNSAKDAGTFRRSLATACASGTVVDRMCGSAAAGNCRTKTGTLRDVSALSGYCTAKHGHRIAFAILMNGVMDIDEAHGHQDHMAALIARYEP